MQRGYDEERPKTALPAEEIRETSRRSFRLPRSRLPSEHFNDRFRFTKAGGGGASSDELLEELESVAVEYELNSCAPESFGQAVAERAIELGDEGGA